MSGGVAGVQSIKAAPLCRFSAFAFHHAAVLQQNGDQPLHYWQWPPRGIVLFGTIGKLCNREGDFVEPAAPSFNRGMSNLRNSLDWLGRWPGKSAQTANGTPHPAAYHMLDVAAVAERLLATDSFSAMVREALVLLVALHDLGKIGAPFRRMLSTGATQTAGRHWEATELLLQEHDALLQHLGRSAHSRYRLYAATAGHHGRPPSKQKHELDRLRTALGSQALEDSSTLIRAFVKLWPQASLVDLDKQEMTRLSWWLPGLTATADWIGSNPNWFMPHAPVLSLPAYLDHARQLAMVAVQSAGLDVAAPAAGHLFNFELRPMQVACQEIVLPPGPTLAFIEDETGSGKTEAAMLLAQRMLLAGKGSGLFIALPTTATADAMFVRVRDSIGRMFQTPPNLTLAHGRAAHSTAFRQLRQHRAAQEDSPGCTDWLADNRRRALLSQVGVGTIDQALLSVLPTRYATLRHYGLASKILIVDEVHEMGEPYMQQELAQLLRAHRMAGGSAILLSATLPMTQRESLAVAFEASVAPSFAYPALTIAGGAVRQDFAPPTGGRGSVVVHRLPDAESALALLQQKIKEGAACVWVRNSVDDAIAAVRMLHERGVMADLLHARFALVDRLKIENQVLSRFGKNGKDRAGRVVVGTQVLESSLDLDFDVMVSDLAPMAALIQRAGRLWRHMGTRPAVSRPVPQPILHVVAPDPAQVGDARWLHHVLPHGAWVYPLDIQWRTADVLFRAGTIDAPSGLRALIEAVHGRQADGVGSSLPEPLRYYEDERIGKAYAQANQARNNLIDLAAGYRLGGGSGADVDYPTRLGQPQRTLMLVRRQGNAIMPWARSGCRDDTPADAWFLSEVSAGTNRFNQMILPRQDDPVIQTLVTDWPEWKRQSIVVCPVDEQGKICIGLRYDSTFGLQFEISTG